MKSPAPSAPRPPATPRSSRAGRRAALSLGIAVSAALSLAAACKRERAREVTTPTTPTLRLVVVGTVAGALEPCGCQKDMLGGVDHAAALVAEASKGVPTLVVGAGPMLFMDPKLPADRATQDRWKAEALASSLRDVGLAAWTPGANDWAAGVEALAALREASGAALLAANLAGKTAGATASVVVERGGEKIGIAGVAVPMHERALPEGVTAAPHAPALAAARDDLRAKGATLLVGLVALDRGEALRAIESVTGFHVIVVGKPSDRGEANDAPTPPVLIGDTLVVQPPNHLQAVAVVDLFVRGDERRFADGVGLAAMEERESLERRVADIEARLARAQSEGAAEADVAARRRELSDMKAKLATLRPGAPPATGSFFSYRLDEVKESVGADGAVAARLGAYYRKVNEHNREVFKDRKPPVAEKDQPTYVGAEECSNCHTEEEDFWKKTRHARAYATLEKDHKEFNLDCVGCHVTGYEKPGGSTVTHVATLKDVQCETCHGPGSRHVATEDPKHIRKTPEKSACASECHHPPHVGPSWSVDEAWKLVIGPGHGG